MNHIQILFSFLGGCVKRIKNEKTGLKTNLLWNDAKLPLWIITAELEGLKGGIESSLYSNWICNQNNSLFHAFFWVEPKLRMLRTVPFFHTPVLLARTVHVATWLMFSVARIIPLSLPCYLGANETRELAGGRCAGMPLSHMGTALFVAFNIYRISVTSKHGFDFICPIHSKF